MEYSNKIDSLCAYLEDLDKNISDLPFLSVATEHEKLHPELCYIATFP
jgi:hypothetical protein